jgi:hypothetical protein
MRFGRRHLGKTGRKRLSVKTSGSLAAAAKGHHGADPHTPRFTSGAVATG